MYINPEETLIIFDEIQENPKAIASLKYFCENAPEYAVIAAGSLLGVAIHKGVSFPVGKLIPAVALGLITIHTHNKEKSVNILEDIRKESI